MFEIIYTNKFKKDVKLALKRNLKLALIQEVINTLELFGELPKKFKPHKLKGDYNGLWECHIQPDWILIWEQSDSLKIISLFRTGTHSDLF